MVFSFRDPKSERELTAISEYREVSKTAVMRHLIREEMRRIRKRRRDS